MSIPDPPDGPPCIDIDDGLGCFRGIYNAVRLELACIAAFVAVALVYYAVGRVL